MHIGFALLTLFPGRVGGSESLVQGLLGEFARGNGPERLTALVNSFGARGYADYAGGNVSIHAVRSYRAGDRPLTRLAGMTAARLAPRIAARDVPRGFDLIHHPLTVPIPRLDGVPVVTTLHDLQHHELPAFFSRPERQFRKWAYDDAARSADAVITVSNHARERAVALLGLEPERVHAVPLGIDHARFHPSPTAADERLGERLPERFVVYPANLWPHKNHDRLLDALGRVGDPDLALVLTGQEYGRGERLRAVARRAGVEGRLLHLGYLEPEEMPALYRAATAMVFPSLYEGFGAPPLEAMACGCPVTSSTYGSLSETIGHAALTMDAGSSESIALAIERVTGDGELRERLRSSGLERAAGFTWAAAAGRHRAIYERTAATSSASC